MSVFQEYDVNTNVDLNQRLPIIHATVEKSPAWESMKVGRKAIISAITGTLHNDATGLDIDLSAKKAGHLISSATRRGIGGKAHIAAVRNIKKLMKTAARVKSYADQDGQQDIKNIHRFYAPLEYDDAVYTVNMTVKEYSGERHLELEGVYKLYDLKLESKTPGGLADELTSDEGPGVRPATGVSVITLGDLLSGVNPDVAL
jgi:hypothetical protein